MLQRAASNAYSWWWASHVRTKQSKWLEQNLQDMEEKVSITLKIINDDGDSFAQRAEMYYRKRPELINFVEEAFRAYRGLAERYDHLSKELQNANRTIGNVFPERVEYAMEDIDDQEDNPSQTSTSFSSHPNTPSKLDSKTSIPKVPKVPGKDFRSPSMLMSRKGTFRRNASSAKAAASVPSSGLTKEEALKAIDDLQKEILGMQTEKEFVKSMYENGYQKFWDIENQITEIQKRVSNLQDEFGVGTVIEDDEARALMAATALKSCQETLTRLQEKQDQSEEEARIEHQRIKEAHEKFERIRAKFVTNQTDQNVVTKKPKLARTKLISKDSRKEQNQEMLREKINEQLDGNSSSSLTVTELAEKIDGLVNKIVSLETLVSSQTGLVTRLRSETDELQDNVRSLEEDKETLMEGSENTNKKLRELEEELCRVKDLNQSIKDQNSNLQTHFTEASSNLDHLSEKLPSVKHDEEIEDAGTVEEEKGVVDAKEEKINLEEQTSKPVESALENSIKAEEEHADNPSNNNAVMDVKPEESIKQEEEEERQDFSEKVDGNVLDDEDRKLVVAKEDEQPNWRQMFLKGLEDREKILLEEYTSVLQDYKEVKKRLSEMENKNRDSIFELAMQIRELKSDVASKDEELKSLKHKLDFPPLNPDESPYTTCSTEYKFPNQDVPGENTTQGASTSTNSEIPSVNLDQESSVSEQIEPNVESMLNLKSSSVKELKTLKKKRLIFRPHSVSIIDEKFRSDIDDLLEENLEFWLRFSTSVHQIRKFQSSIEDLHSELAKVRENNKKQEGLNSNQCSLQSEARPIYRHLREIQTEMSLWLEQNAVLKDELQGRFSSLCRIHNDIAMASAGISHPEKTELSEYQAAKFQGEILNMKQENNKVKDELQLGFNRVQELKVEVEKTLEKLDEELGFSGSKHSQSSKHHRPRIPLRSFLFGVKLRRQKPSSSIFSCVSPALQKQYSDLEAAGAPP
ncbi:hypothetical protein UlMin_036181 [Ulmus minor]